MVIVVTGDVNNWMTIYRQKVYNNGGWSIAGIVFTNLAFKSFNESTIM